LLEGGGVGRKQVAVPAQLGREAAERPQELHVEPDAGDVKVEEIALHEPDELVGGKMPALRRQIERHQSLAVAGGGHFSLIGEHDA
jgi:hypothetical protein